MIPYTHLLRANAIGECYTPTPFSNKFLSSLAEYDGYLLMTFDMISYTKILCSAVNKFFQSILLASALPCTWLGGGYNQISAAMWRGVQPLKSYTHLSCAYTIGECCTPLS